MKQSRPIAATTFGFLYRSNLDDALRQIAEAGYRQVELAVGPPHFAASPLGRDERHRLRKQLERYELTCVSTNPLELNPVTANSDLFEAACRQYQAAIELSAEIGAGAVVMVAGRRSPLVPMPIEAAKGLLEAQLNRLLPIAEQQQVTLTLEAVPYGFIETARDALAFVEETGMSDLRLTIDCANVFFAGADPAEELRAASSQVAVVHISDTRSNRWGHTQIGHGEVDFASFAAAVEEIGYSGPTVYELADEEDPAPRLRSDLGRLADLGWAPAPDAVNPP